MRSHWQESTQSEVWVREQGGWLVADSPEATGGAGLRPAALRGGESCALLLFWETPLAAARGWAGGRLWGMGGGWRRHHGSGETRWRGGSGLGSDGGGERRAPGPVLLGGGEVILRDRVGI